MKFSLLSIALLAVGGADAFVPSSFGVAGSTRQSLAINMAAGGPQRVKPIGVGHSAPQTVITNSDLETVVDTTDEWIKTRTGISQRHVLTGDEKIRDVATEAAKNALDMSGVDALDIDLVIVATSSADDLYGDATTVAHNLGCTNAFAYDLTAACSGFMFGLVTAGQFIDHEGGLRNAIVVGSDALSRYTDWTDRNSCILFGDGAGAMVLTSQADDEEESGFLGYAAHSNGGGYDKLNAPFESTGNLVPTRGDGTNMSKGSYSCTQMVGREVYKFATREVPRVLTEALEKADMTADDVDWLLLHQANIRIMEVVADRLGMPHEKILTNLSDYGNTSAASIPIAFDEAVRSGQVKKGDIIACSGFGAGLSWGSVILRWGGEPIVEV